jgi:hypothetical protein
MKVRHSIWVGIVVPDVGVLSWVLMEQESNVLNFRA